MPWYRLRVTWTYSTTNAANTAATNINSALAAAGHTETATRPTTSSVEVIIEPLTESAATDLRTTLTSAWATGTRTAGKASVVRRDETSG